MDQIKKNPEYAGAGVLAVIGVVMMMSKPKKEDKKTVDEEKQKKNKKLGGFLLLAAAALGGYKYMQSKKGTASVASMLATPTSL